MDKCQWTDDRGLVKICNILYHYQNKVTLLLPEKNVPLERLYKLDNYYHDYFKDIIAFNNTIDWVLYKRNNLFVLAQLVKIDYSSQSAQIRPIYTDIPKTDIKRDIKITKKVLEKN